MRRTTDVEPGNIQVGKSMHMQCILKKNTLNGNGRLYT